MKDADLSAHNSVIREELWEEKEYWLDTLSGELVKSCFPYDYATKTRDERNTGEVKFTFTGEILSRLMRLRNDSDPRLHMILVAGVDLLVHKYTGIRDIIVGTTIDKQDTGTEYINTTLPLRNQIEEDMTFKQLLLQVRDTTAGAIENQNYPIEDLLDKLNIIDNQKEIALFDIAVILENIQDKTYLEHVPCSLGFSFLRTPAGIEGSIHFNASRYRRITVERIANHFKHLLRQSIFNVDLLLSDIDILSEKEKKQLLVDFNDNAAEFPSTQTLHHFIETHEQQTPDRVALVYEDEHPGERIQVTYKAINQQANPLSHLLRDHGIKEDKLVGIMMRRSPLMVGAILAAWKAGGAYIPIDPGYPQHRLNEILIDSGTTVLLTETQYVSTQLKKSYPGKMVELNFPINENSREVDCGCFTNPDLEIDMNSLAYVIYTSGSTGKPKGVMVEHIGMMNHIQAKINDLQLISHSIVVQNASHTFDISVWQFFAPLTSGGKTIIYSNPLILESEQFISRLIKDNITILEVVPSYLSILLDTLDAMDFKPRQLGRLDYLLVTGEAVKPALVRRWFNTFPGTRMVNAYGPTEASDDITHYIMDQAPDMDQVPIGKPVQNMNIYIVSQHMKLCPIGVKGEICVSGIGVGRGYLKDDEQTRRVFMEDPFTEKKGVRLYKTGDIGRWLADGVIEFFGRKDHQVKIRGFRIELGEIEVKLADHPLVKEAVVVDKKDDYGNKYLCAYLVPQNRLEIETIRHYLMECVPDYMVPASFVQLDEMPLTGNGKIDRKNLPEPEMNSKSIPYISEKMFNELAASFKENFGEQKVDEYLKSNENKELYHVVPAVHSKIDMFKCFIIGETTLPIKCAEILLKHGHDLLGIISNNWQVNAWAKRHGIPLTRAKKEDIMSFLKKNPFDYLFSANNLVILPEEIIRLANRCVFNYHNALLPTYAGSYAPYRAIMNMEKTYGITWHVMDTGIDTGDIVKQIPLEIDAKDTGVSLNTKCYNAGVDAFEELVTELESQGVVRRKQNLDARTYLGRYERPVSGALFSFTWDAFKIDALIRGLNFGNYDNPLGMPKISMGKDFFIIPEISIQDSDSQYPPGTITHINSGSFTVSTKTKDLEIKKILSINGEEITVPEFIEKYDLHEGYKFADLNQERANRLNEYNLAVCRHENFWIRRISRLQALSLIEPIPPDLNDRKNGISYKVFPIPEEIKHTKEDMPQRDFLIAAFSAYLSLLTGIPSFDIGYTDDSIQYNVKGLEGLFARQVPLEVQLDKAQTFAEFCQTMEKELKRIRKRKTYTRDIFIRYPKLKLKIETIFSIAVTCVNDLEDFGPPEAKQLHLVVPENGNTCMLVYNRSIIDENHINTFLRHFSVFLQRTAENPSICIAEQIPTNFILKGRIDGTVRIGGFRIDPGEIERYLLEHNKIRKAVVVVKDKQINEKYLCACIVSEKNLTESEIRVHLSGKLPHYMIPSYFVQLEKIPLTPEGKLDRKLLEKIDITVEPNYIPPRNEVEQKLLEIWTHELRLGPEKSRIGMKDNFFGVGGDSIKSISLLSRINKEFNIELKMVDLYKNDTIETLAEVIDQYKNVHSTDEYTEALEKMEDLKAEFLEGI